jgi:DNA-binding PadR family transcriptional regulator
MAAMREFLRGAVQLHILHHAAEGEIHGAWMSQELADHGYEISPGTLYPTLHRLEDEGLLSSRSTVEEGHSLRVYKITPEGRKILRQTRKALKELSEEVLDD